ncbi:dodecenoyl-CoA isomerase [Dimargaris cristalligena]|uniref:ClpP/crotonase-like domain-containing protein n=1 Tax=Dimargaris cristalligena TaxID=215637 RepID=A0A4P9ZYI6_9FUNG|nr:dodecenoyl-CoA isomerase [Dimargaris cristalligena]RKP38825.1 ClpP/crotonase-like domain-containing protein [Dimargaris cristalligena]|eukprot:RKP38825.1 ClpP/crotonase-like domain-containing protein [Dimargaris cristalligena]
MATSNHLSRAALNGTARLNQLSGHLQPTQRALTTGTKTANKPNHLVRLVVSEQDPTIAVVSFSRPPANSFNLPFLQALHKTLAAVLAPTPAGTSASAGSDADPEVTLKTAAASLTTPEAVAQGIQSNVSDFGRIRSLVLTSDTPNFFSAGIDITVFLSRDPSRPLAGVDQAGWVEFWGLVRQVYILIYTSARIRTVAAINGHAPGLGAILALACHDRIMANPLVPTPAQRKTPARIGLNEVQIGLTLPCWLADRFAEVAGQRAAERDLPLGTMYSPPEALAVGLVDQVVDIPPEVPHGAAASPLVHSAVEFIQKRIYARLPPLGTPAGDGAWGAQMGTYLFARRSFVVRFEADEHMDLFGSYKFVVSKPVQSALLATLKRLQKK